MLTLLLVFAGGLRAQDFTFSPVTIHQGETLQLHAPKNAAKARMNGITIPLFPENGGMSGLMPVAVEDDPGEYKLEFLDQAGSVIHNLSVNVLDAHYTKQNIVISQALSELRSSSEEREKFAAFVHSVSPVKQWEEPFRLPVPGCKVSPFGASRLHNGKPTGDYHGGIDQRGATGTPIHAMAAGTVKVAGMFQLRGGAVAIDHGQGLQSVYMHMSKVAVKEGQQVEAGDIIGYVGATGRATGPHLHWSVYANGHPVNPGQWVKVPAACGAPPAKAPVKGKKRSKKR